MYFRGEPGDGKWTVVVKDTNINEHSGTFTDWRMTLWGESIDESIQKLYPLPKEDDDDDHDDEDDDDDDDDEENKTVSAIISTTSISVTSLTDLPTHPTDHPERPVNNKHKTTVTSSTVSPTSATTTKPTAAAASDTTPTATSTFLLPSIFPTFGVSPRTQIWIYGAIGAIIVFCAALGAFFCIWRRRSTPNRADYEFEMLDDQDNSGAGAPLSGGTRHRRRAGELYDAFAGESDEEVFSEDDGEYKDEPERSVISGSGGSTPPQLNEKR